MKILYNILKISSLTCIIKIIGFIKDITIANIFGINKNTDSFFISLKLQNLLRKIFTDGFISYLFIPILSKYKNKKCIKDTEQLISSIYFFLLIILFILSYLNLKYANYIILISSLQNSNIKNYNNNFLIIKLYKYISPFIISITLSYFFALILNLWNITYPIIFISFITNINIIFFSIFISKYFKIPIISLIISIILSSLIQFTFQRIFFNKIKLNICINNINLLHKGFKKIIIKLIPSIFGILIYNISNIINSNILLNTKIGSVSWTHYADKLTELPLNIFGGLISTILLAKLSNIFYKKNIIKYNKIIDKYLQSILLIIIPLCFFFIICSKLLISTLFQYGKFTYTDVLKTSNILIINTLSLPALILNKILITCFYSQQNLIIPNIIFISASIFSQILNFFTLKWFNYIGISISNCIIAYLKTILLYLILKINNKFKHHIKWNNFFYKIIISNLIIIIILYLYASNLELYFIKYNFLKRFFYIIYLIILTITIYTINLWIINIKKEDLFIK